MDGFLNLRDRRNAANGVTKTYLQSLVDQGAQNFRNGNNEVALGFLTQVLICSGYRWSFVEWQAGF